jgi:hypothetical protein
MTNYRKALIYSVVVGISLMSGILSGSGMIPQQFIVVTALATGFFLGIVGRIFFWGDNS